MKPLLHGLALLAWCAWLAFECLAFGPASYIRQHDTAEVNTPFYTALPQLDERRLTGWWDPLAGTSVDALSNLKGDMPVVEALFRYAPHWSNSGVLLLAQSFVAALGIFVLLRSRMHVDPAAALLAAAWFAFLPWVGLPQSGFPTWYGWYVAGFPLTVHALEWCSELPGGRGTVPAAAVGAVLALGTPTASGMLVVPLAVIWVPAAIRCRTAPSSTMWPSTSNAPTTSTIAGGATSCASPRMNRASGTREPAMSRAGCKKSLPVRPSDGKARRNACRTKPLPHPTSRNSPAPTKNRANAHVSSRFRDSNQ